MRANYRLTLAGLAGVAFGAIAVSGLSAQTKPVAYYISQIQLTGDADAYVKNYASQVAATVEPFGGRIVVRGGKVVGLEGDPPRPRIAVIVFDSMEKAQAWYNSPAYKKIAPVRQTLAKTNSFIVEGPSN